MARLGLSLTLLCCLRTITFIMVQAGLLPIVLLAVTALAQRCTRAVPVHKYPAQEIQVLRRIPATCSNWDKTWAWLTNKDCNTKYRLETVTVPPREVKQYKLQHYCCDGADKCEEAENIHSGGFDSTDAKFLAVVLGSTAACVVIIIIIFAITFYTKKSRCHLCTQSSHAYTSAGECSDGEDSREDSPVEDKPCPVEGRAAGGRVAREHGARCWDSDTDQPEVKGAGEAVYAEIGEPGDRRLPRYADIFRDGEERVSAKKHSSKTITGRDPFSHASAPPMYTEVSRSQAAALSVPEGGCREEKRHGAGAGGGAGGGGANYVNAPNAVRAPPCLRSASEPSGAASDAAEIQVIQPSVQSARRISDGACRQQSKLDGKSTQHQPQQAQLKVQSLDKNDPKYYNVREKKRKKRRSGGGGGTMSNSEHQQLSTENRHTVTSADSKSGDCPKSRGNVRRGKAGDATRAMEMTLSKSCSASETIGRRSGESSETSLSRAEKRRSAPPGSGIYQNQILSQAPLRAQTPPTPPQSAVPQRPSSMGGTTQHNPSTGNTAKSKNVCSVIYEAQAPPSNHSGREKKTKSGRKINASHVSSKPSAAASAAPNCYKTLSNPSLAEGPKGQGDTRERCPEESENAGVASVGADSTGQPQSSVPHQPSLHSTNSINANASNGGGNNSQCSEAENTQPYSPRPSAEGSSSQAAVLNLSPVTHPSDTAGSLSDSGEAVSAGNLSPSSSSSANQVSCIQTSLVQPACESAYDKLQFQDSAPSAGGSSPCNVYQTLNHAQEVQADSSITYANNVGGLSVVDNADFTSGGLERQTSTEQTDTHASDTSEECDIPPPVLPPRCPRKISKHAVDSSSIIAQ